MNVYIVIGFNSLTDSVHVRGAAKTKEGAERIQAAWEYESSKSLIVERELED